MTIEHLSVAPNNSTKLALQDTVLTPRFYTPDFEELDRLDVSSDRKRVE